jgi:hypothetical protein
VQVESKEILVPQAQLVLEQLLLMFKFLQQQVQRLGQNHQTLNP